MEQIVAVQEKIDVVKTSMKENIQQLLINEEKMDRIEHASIHLNEQSIAFKKGSKELMDKMWWKMCKTRMIIAAVLVGVLLIIVIPITISGK